MKMPTDVLEPKRIEIPYRAYPLMKAIHADQTRIRVIDAGRQIGKSLFALIEGFCMSYDALQKGVKRPMGMITAPTNDMLLKNWVTANTVLKAEIQQSVISEHRIDLGHLGQIEFKSTESQGGAGRGGTYDWAVMDEAAFSPAESWEADIRPALTVKFGRAVIISTPRGLNWFYDLWRLGQDGDPDVKSWKYSTLEGWRSRFAHDPERLAQYEKEWQLVQRITSEAKFKEEYLAEFLADQGQHFTLKDGLWRGILREAVPGHHYVAGVDVARKEDWMVTAIMEVESQQLVALVRSRHQDWAIQKAISLEVLRQYPQCLTYVDSTGVGDPIAQDLRASGINVMDVIFTPGRKSELVENLTLAIEQCYLGIPRQQETDWLRDELQCYQSVRMPSGAIRYGAPEGKHDDGVTALMLAAWGLQGSWKQPQLEQTLQPEWFENPLVPANGWDALHYAHEVDRFQRQFPHAGVPVHPYDLRWQTHLVSN